MGVITMPFSGLAVQWYSWISEQVIVKKNNTRSFSPVVSGWTKVMKERHSRACLAQRRHVFLCGRSSTKIFAGIIFLQFGWCPRKQRNLITLENLCPYGIYMYFSEEVHGY